MGEALLGPGSLSSLTFEYPTNTADPKFDTGSAANCATENAQTNPGKSLKTIANRPNGLSDCRQLSALSRRGSRLTITPQLTTTKNAQTNPGRTLKTIATRPRRPQISDNFQPYPEGPDPQRGSIRDGRKSHNRKCTNKPGQNVETNSNSPQRALRFQPTFDPIPRVPIHKGDRSGTAANRTTENAQTNPGTTLKQIATRPNGLSDFSQLCAPSRRGPDSSSRQDSQQAMDSATAQIAQQTMQNVSLALARLFRVPRHTRIRRDQYNQTERDAIPGE